MESAQGSGTPKQHLTYDPFCSAAVVRIFFGSYMLTYLATKEIHKYSIDMNVGNSDEAMGQKIQVKFLVSKEDFSLLQTIETGSGANPVSYSLLPGVPCLMEKWLQHKKSDFSPPSEATIKNN